MADSKVFVEAFSRDPSTLFLSCDELNSSMGNKNGYNSSNGGGYNKVKTNSTTVDITTKQVAMYGNNTRCRQPVWYHRPILACSVGPFHKGDQFHSASVDWVQGKISLFMSMEDVLNCVPIYSSLENALPAALEEHGDTYVRETFAFLLRGHSLFDPQCKCNPWDTRRARLLGILNTRSILTHDSNMVTTTTTTTITGTNCTTITIDNGFKKPKNNDSSYNEKEIIESDLDNYEKNQGGQHKLYKSMAKKNNNKNEKRKKPIGTQTTKKKANSKSTFAFVEQDYQQQEQCLAKSIAKARTVDEIQLELGLRNLMGCVEVNLRNGPCKLPLLHVLVRLGGLIPEGQTFAGHVYALGHPSCCIPSLVKNAEDIEHAARVLAPRPYVFEPNKYDIIAQRSIWEYLDQAKRSRRIRVLEADIPGAWAIFWNNDFIHLEPLNFNDSSQQKAMNILNSFWKREAPKPPILMRSTVSELGTNGFSRKRRKV